MNKFKVNGVDLEYDILELDEMERYYDVTDRITEELQNTEETERPVDRLRRVCESVLEGFDALFGAGTAREIFGDRIYVDDIMLGYTTMVNAMNEAMSAGTAEINAAMQAAPRNRAERRAQVRSTEKRAAGR